MTKVELVYDHDCPNVSRAREEMMRAFAETGISPRWDEWVRGDADSPDYVRGYGSPTILVDGEDVAGATPSDGVSCCRLYAGPSGEMRGFPSVRMIVSALRAGAGHSDVRRRPKRATGWRSSLAALPGVFAAILPHVT